MAFSCTCYYFTDTTQIQVFSRAEGKWLSPIPITPPAGTTERLNTLYVYGAKLSPDGRLIFQPTTNGIDVFGNGLGNLQDRVSLPVPPSPNYDALVSDGKDNVLIAITGATGNGIAVVDLTSIAEPLALTSNIKRFAEQGIGSHREQEVGKHPEKRSPQSAVRPHTAPHITKPLLLHAKRVRSLP